MVNLLKINLSAVILIIYLAGMSYYLFSNQYYNADMEAYMGLVYKINDPEMPITEIHKKVFDELKQKKSRIFEENVNKKEEALGENTYYHIISQNPRAFAEELNFFSVKPVYNFINSVFYKIGFSVSTSTFLISIVSYVLILLFTFFYLQKIVKSNYVAFFITILLSLFKPLLDASRHATPDVLSCLLLLLSFYYFVSRRNLFIATIFAMFTILTRPEYYIFYSFLWVLIVLYKRKFHQKSKELIFCFFYLSLSFVLIQLFSQIPWSVLFVNQFIKVQLYPVSNPDLLSFSEYILFIKSKLLIEFNNSYFPLLLIFAITSVFSKFSLKSENFVFFLLFFIIIYLVVFIRFLIFPILVNRMMIGFYLVIILTLIYLINYKKIIEEK